MTDEITPDDSPEITPIQRLTRDLASAAVTLSDKEVRFLVDAYYQIQDARIRHAGQVRSMDKEDPQEPHLILDWLTEQNSVLEQQIKRALDRYSDAHPVGEWLRDIKGIGPVIASGLLAHIDIREAPTAGHIWRFAGLDPSVKWEKKTKRPWNTRLKVLCWKAGESFVKLSNDEDCFYGSLYKRRKEVYQQRNDAGEYADRSAKILTEKNFKKDTEAYKAYSQGKFPPAHIHAMARRFAVKMMLSHLHGQMYRVILRQEPPLPFPLAHKGHTHMIPPPH
jgi:hypothetical protein